MNNRKQTSTLKVAVSQMVGKLIFCNENISLACKISRIAGKQNAKLILFPEGCLNGNAFIREDQSYLLANSKSFIALQKVSDSYEITICIGFTSLLCNGFNNSFAIIQANKEIMFQYKCSKASSEPEFLVAYTDERRSFFEINGVRIVISICSEYGVERIENAISKIKPNLILHPSAGYEKDGQEGTESNMELKLQTRAKSIIKAGAMDALKREYSKISANPLGFDGKIWWPGNSYAASYEGKVLLEMSTKIFSKIEPDIEPAIVDIPIK